MKNKNISKFVTSLIYILLGCALIAEPTLVEDMFSYMLAGSAIIIGVVKLISYLFTNVETRISEDTNGFALGISLMILGAFILMESAMFIMLIPFVLGFMITFKGVEGVQNVLNLRKFGYGVPKVTLILSLLITGFGILVMINPFSTKKLLLVMLGIGLAVSGLFDFIADIIFTRKIKKGPQAPAPAPEPAEPELDPEPVPAQNAALEEPAADPVSLAAEEEYVEFKSQSDDVPTL